MIPSLIRKLLENRNSYYWILSRENSYRHLGNMVKCEPSVVLTCVDFSMVRGDCPYMELSIKEVEEFGNQYVDSNIFLTGEHVPFQCGMSLRSFHNGFKWGGREWKKDNNQHLFLIEALKLESTDIYDYEKLFKSMTVEEADNGN